jgi:hypothetical protein
MNLFFQSIWFGGGFEVLSETLSGRGEIAHHQVKAAPKSCWSSAIMHLRYFTCEFIFDNAFWHLWSC